MGACHDGLGVVAASLSLSCVYATTYVPFYFYEDRPAPGWGPAPLFAGCGFPSIFIFRRRSLCDRRPGTHQ
jgi:hypothetical protein